MMAVSPAAVWKLTNEEAKNVAKAEAGIDLMLAMQERSHLELVVKYSCSKGQWAVFVPDLNEKVFAVVLSEREFGALCARYTTVGWFVQNSGPVDNGFLIFRDSIIR